MPKKNISAKESLQKEVKEKFGKTLNSVKSFEELAAIVHVSSQTLRRFYGKIDKEKELSFSSLSIICQFVGYRDWNDYLYNFENDNAIPLKDQIFIEGMQSFFRIGQSYNEDYQQKTLITDTMNEYAQVIYKSKENIKYFYKLYKNNNWASDYIFAWLPNYNFFGQDWFREILKDRIRYTKNLPTKLALNNFIIFGNFLTGAQVNLQCDFADVQRCYQEYKLNSPYSPYHEMRYHTILLINAKSNNNHESFQKVLDNYLTQLNEAGLSKIQYQELMIAFCNTLLWLQEYKIAYQLLKPIKNFISNYEESRKEETSMHFLGINMAFVKTTFALTWLTNQQDFSLDIKPIEFNDTTGLLYNDYIKIMYLATCIIFEKTTLKKKVIYSTLQKLVKKTGYAKIYDILCDNDSNYNAYSI